jgi:hypothetical protein
MIQDLKYFKLLVIGLFLCSCASQQKKVPGTDLNEKLFELNPVRLEAPTMTFQELKKEVSSLNRYIGGYPPHFSNESERDKIYKKWLSLVSEAEAYNKVNQMTEKSLYLLSALYRQGHNMDVNGSAEKALKYIDSCLQIYTRSVSCNFTASYFFLSIGPAYLDKAENSLSTLKKHYEPSLNEEVEAGYVFLYLYRQNVPMVKKQIDSFIKNFPDSSRVEVFVKIRENIGETIERKQQ